MVSDLQVMVGSQPQLFYWQPEGYGPYSYFVLAISADEAARLINAWRSVERLAGRDYGVHIESTKQDLLPEDLKMARPGEVVVNDNH